MSIFSIFSPAKHIERLPDKQIDAEYKNSECKFFGVHLSAMPHSIYCVKISLLLCRI